MYYTERLMLRSLDVEADKASVVQWMNEAEFRWGASAQPPTPVSRDDVAKLLQPPSSGDPITTLYRFAICLRPPPEQHPTTLGPTDDAFLLPPAADTPSGSGPRPRYPIIGYLALHAGSRGTFAFTNQTVSIGLAFGPAWRGRGYGTEVLRWTLAFAFRDLNLHRVDLSVGAWNAAAVRCYEKAGFVGEGRLRETIWREGKREDVLMMAILRPEWEAKQGVVELQS